jgi:hypothetical protein
MVLFRLNRRVLSDANTLAAYTGEIFSHVASLSGNTHVIRSIGRANDHLYYIRTIECRHLNNVQDELRLICELLLAGNRQELLRTIHRYHDKRTEILPTLLELATR